MKKIFYSFVLIFVLAKPVTAQVIAQDSLAVYDLYFTNTGAPPPAGPVTTWPNLGIEVTGDRITSLSITAFFTMGPIFLTSSMGNLTALKKLSIRGGGLRTGLGSFPASLTGLIALEEFSICCMQFGFTNSDPVFSMPWIKKISMNSCEGAFIPSAISNITSLEYLNVAGNIGGAGISGSIYNCTNLEYLNLSNNLYQGAIPQAIGRLTKLKYYNTNFVDYPYASPIPDSIGYCTQLRVLNLGGGNIITGQIPASITNCRNLSTIIFYGDENMTGVNHILQNIHLFPNLDTLQINQNINQTPHRIPDAIGRLSRLTNLSLSGYGFSGSTITDSITNCTNLKTLSLNSSNFVGTLPVHMGNLTNLTSFSVSNNSLTGPIPASLFTLNPPLSINLSSNRFTFDGLEQLKQRFGTLTASPQPNISIRYYGNRLSVSAGGTLANNTYKWYKGGVLYRTVTGDSTLSTTEKGTYHAEVTNSVLTELKLTSGSIYVPLKLCPPAASFSLTSSSVGGSSFQWQMNDGTGYANISDNANFSGTTTPFLDLSNIPSSWTGYSFRCFISNSFYSSAEPIKFETLWTGISSTNWEDAGNWNCSAIPDSGTDVVITSGSVVVNSDATIRSLFVAPGASLTVSPGVTLTVLH